MKLKELENYLTQCEPFTKPKVKLEQYPTSSHIASRMLYSAQENIQGALVCDLGSGCGILSIGSILVGAAFVVGFEIDSEAIAVARENAQGILDEDSVQAIDFVQIDINPGEKNGLKNFAGVFDVVIMNPPFGTKNNEGIDWTFVLVALQLVKPGGHIYSLHKTSTRPFFTKKFKAPFRIPSDSNEAAAELENDQIVPGKPPTPTMPVQVHAKVLAEVQFNLPKVYKFHKEKSVDVSVDFWCFQKVTSAPDAPAPAAVCTALTPAPAPV